MEKPAPASRAEAPGSAEALAVSWIDFSESLAVPAVLESIGGWVSGEDWDRYITRFDEAPRRHLETLRAAIVSGKLRHSGEEYRSDPKRAPIFSDGTTILFTERAWGDLMAAIWNTEEKTDKYGFHDFVCAEPPVA